MKVRKFVAMFLMLCLVMVAACGNSESKNDNGGGSGDSSDNSAANNDSKDDVDDDDDLMDLDEINVVYMAMTGMPDDLQEVEDAINAITEKEINTHVNIEMIETANYDQQISLKQSSSEKMDLVVTLPYGASGYSTMVNQNQFMDITDLLQEYAPDLLDTVGEIIDATKVDGRTYGIPTYRMLLTNAYITMRTDVLEDLDMLEFARNMTTFAEYEEILEAVKNSEKWGHLSPLVSSDGTGTTLPLSTFYIGSDKFADAATYDQLGDTSKLIAVKPDGSDPTIYNNFASEGYKAMLERVHDWYDKGYIHKDAATAGEQGVSLIKLETAFSVIEQGEIGIETTKAQQTGMPMTCVKITDGFLSTSSAVKFVWGIPNTATEPEAAAKFLNMMYTDERVANLLAWGIEDKHYVVTDGVAGFLDGEATGYNTNDYVYGNQFLVYPWTGQSSDFRDQALAEMNNGVMSAYYGFSCDTSEIQTEISSVSNVIAEYRSGLDAGSMGMDRYEEFLEKLDAAGAQTIIDEYQRQLDAWIAAQ